MTIPKFDRLVKGYNSALPTDIQEALYWPRIAHSAGGMISSMSDLLTWNRALYHNKILPKFLTKRMLTPYAHTNNMQTQDQKSPDPMLSHYFGYGYGILETPNIGRMYSHSGGIHGFNSLLFYIPELKFSIACSTPVMDFAAVEQLQAQIQKLNSLLRKTPEQEKGKYASQLEIVKNRGEEVKNKQLDYINNGPWMNRIARIVLDEVIYQI